MYICMHVHTCVCVCVCVCHQPFWPLGTGIARGFLASFDTAWMVRSWGLGKAPLEVLAQRSVSCSILLLYFCCADDCAGDSDGYLPIYRESIYQLLSQTTPENTCKNYSAYSINPATRYNQIKLTSIQVNQVST